MSHYSQLFSDLSPIALPHLPSSGEGKRGYLYVDKRERMIIFIGVAEGLGQRRAFSQKL